ncbi:MAG TPA: alpha/beta fold hydrolase [Anaerolineae bacterium]|nr:alpha/beta fold hydrolase [Anaerolineae bacterium]
MADATDRPPAQLRGSDLHAGEAFLFEGGPIGCALLHGFTAAPREMRPLGRYLNDAGFTVHGVRLAGHGTRPEDLARTGWREWYASAHEAVSRLRGGCRRVFACGLSLGGALALLLGARGEVDGVISIATPLHPAERRLKYARFIAPFKRYTPKGFADLHDPAARADHADYLRVPTRAAANLHHLIGLLERELPRVNAPVLIIHSRLDRVVPPEDAQAIFKRVATADKRLVWLERGGHIATEDYDKAIVFEETRRFIEAHSR